MPVIELSQREFKQLATRGQFSPGSHFIIRYWLGRPLSPGNLDLAHGWTTLAVLFPVRACYHRNSIAYHGLP